jgi:branched-chain amino acid transport system ATP-binding protein
MIELVNGVVDRNGKKIIENVDFRIERGETTLLFGPNGSGKSTVFHAIMGVIGLTSGEILMDGENITHLPVHKRFLQGITLAPEKMRVAPNLTVKENLLIGGSDVSKVYNIFPNLKKLRKQRASTLSGGERQMVVFGRALLTNPKYLLLDEPFQGLQKEAGDKIIEVIEKLKKENVGVAIISHERIKELIQIADKFYIMIAGRVAYEARIETVEGAIEKLGEYMLV